MAGKINGDEQVPTESQMQTAYSSGGPGRGGSQRQGIVEAATKSFIRSIAASLGRMLIRAITGRMR